MFRRPTRTSLDYLFLRRRVVASILRFRPDIVHAHRIQSYGYLGMKAVQALRRSEGDARFILSVWGEDVFSFPRRSTLHRWFTHRVLDSADQILSTSHVMKAEALRYIEPRREILVTPFGVDTARFNPPGGAAEDGAAQESAAGHADFGDAARGGDVTANERPRIVVGTVKKLRPRYGVDILIRSFARARSNIADAIDLRLEIVGEGPQMGELQALTTALSVDDYVTFRGRVPHAEVPDLLASFDLFAALSVSDDESFGVAMIEASAMELPVVSTRVGGIPEVVIDGTTGILTRPGSEEEAAVALETLARDPALRSKMGRAGRTFVRERYDWSNTAARMRTIYEEVYRSGRT